MNWIDPKSGELTEGFKEKGFLPEAFLNMLAVLGWNDGTEQEIFSLEDLVKKFSIERVHKGGAKFDFEKAKWFNHEWIKQSSNERLFPDVKSIFDKAGIPTNEQDLIKIIGMVKERLHASPRLPGAVIFFFVRPVNYDLAAMKGKWDDNQSGIF
jgi:glutamyl-tRNA synthetase